MTAPTRTDLIFTGSIKSEPRTSTTRSLFGTVVFPGRATARVNVTTTRYIRSKISFPGRALPLKNLAYGAFRDWAHYADAMIDPARVLVAQSTSGVAYDAASIGNFRRVSTTVSAPREYAVSDGTLWPRAAFVAVGTRVKNMPAGTWQYADGAQVEISPKGVNAPTAYVPARALNIVVKPDAMNYVKNPQTAAALAPGTSETRSMTGVVGKYYAGFTKVTSAPVGSVVRVTVEDSSGVVSDSGPQTVGPTGVIGRVIVKALQPTVATALTLRLAVVSSTGTVNFNLCRIDRVNGPGPLGNVDFIDGSLGVDYLWGGAANNSESYYYRNRATRAYLLTKVLAENSPLGVIPGDPQYAVLPTE